MKYAWVENDAAREVVSQDPNTIFGPELAAKFSQVPDTVVVGSTLDPGTDTWTAPPARQPVARSRIAAEKPLTPIQFKLLFTSQERITIKASTDPVIVDFLEIINDPKLGEVELGDTFTTDALNYLEAQGLIDAGRAAEILAS